MNPCRLCTESPEHETAAHIASPSWSEWPRFHDSNEAECEQFTSHQHGPGFVIWDRPEVEPAERDPMTDVTALAFALHDEKCDCSGLDLKRYAERAEAVIGHLARNGWRLVHESQNPTWDYMDYIQRVHDEGKGA